MREIIRQHRQIEMNEINLKRFILLAGCRLHQSGQRRVCVHARSRAGRRRRDEGIGAAGQGADVLVSVLLVHGKRDQLPVEAVPGRGVEGQVLGSVSCDSQRRRSNSIMQIAFNLCTIDFLG